MDSTTGFFEFKGLKTLGVPSDFTGQTPKYLIEISGCGYTFQRSATDSKDQNISAASDVAAKSLSLLQAQNTNLNAINLASYKSLLANLERYSTDSRYEVLTALKTDASLRSQFISTFGFQPDEIGFVKPTVSVPTFNLTQNEASTLSITANVTHWNTDYVPAAQWYLGSTVVSSTAALNISFDKNSQGSKVLRLRVGADDGGLFDVTKPIFEQTFSLTVANTYPPIPPAMTLIGSTPTASTSVQVSVDTGAAMVNCDTFSTMALTESPYVAPILPSEFNLSCATAGTQTENFTISPADGLKTLSLWVRDSNGNISLSPSIATVSLDRVDPEVTLPTIAIIKGGSSYSIAYTASDPGSGLQALELFYAPDGVTFSSVANLINQTPPYVWSVPAANTSAAKLKLVATDNTGRSSQVISSAFMIDSTPPALSFSSPSANSTQTASVTVSGACESGTSVVISGTAVSSSISAPCTTNLFSANIAVQGSDGAKTLVLTQSDAVGNSASVTRSITKDTTGPAVSVTSPVASEWLSGAVQTPTINTKTITWTATDTTGVATTVEAIEYTLNNGTTWQSIVTGVANSGSYTWTVPQINAASAKVRVRIRDVLGNETGGQSSAFRIDSTAPTIALPIITNKKGGATLSITYTASDSGAGLQSVELFYAEDGTTFTSIATPTSPPYVWTVPADDTVLAKLKLAVSDNVGVVSEVTSNAFTIDSTPPTLSFSAPAANSTQGASVTVSGACESGLSVVISGTAVSSSVSTPCTSSLFSASISVQGSDGAKTITITQTDEVGNLTSLGRVITKDATGPTVTVTSPAASEWLSGATQTPAINTKSIAWTVSDTTGVATTVEGIEYTVNSGTTWVSIATGVSNSGSYLWTVPAIDSTAVKARVRIRDTIGNETAGQSAVFKIDSTAPSRTLPTIANQKGGTTLSLAYTASDAGSGLQSVELLYAQDGSTFTSVATLTGQTPPYAWSVPADDTTSAKLKLTVSDNAGVKSEVVSGAFTIDSTPPTLSFSVPAANSSQPATVIVAGACESSVSVVISGTAVSTPVSTACASSLFSTSITLQGSDGTKTITITQTDAVGNSTSVSRSVTKDTTAPILAISSPTANTPWASSVTVTGTCESASAATVSISGSGITSATTANCTSNAFTKALTLSAGDGTKAISFSQTDAAGNTGSTSVTLVNDNTGPDISVGSFKLNGSTTPASTFSIYAIANFTATDANSKVKDYCIKLNSTTAPASSDSCWHSLSLYNVSPATTIIVNDQKNLYVTLGLSSATYTAYLWVRDEIGNRSELSSSATPGTDWVAIPFSQAAPPSVTSVTAYSTNSPSSPVSNSDLTIGSGSTVYVKWNASSSSGLSSNPISIYYSTNDSTWILAKSGLADGVNGTCTVGAGQTGCFEWNNVSPLTGSPSGAYYRVRVVALNAQGVTKQANSNPVNVTSIRFLAGNTDIGVGAHAGSAILNVSDPSGTQMDMGSFVVTPNGTTYFRDSSTGILKIDPITANVQVWIPTTGAMSADGGLVSSATLKSPTRIALDSQNRLYIWDDTQIRRVNLNDSNPTINKVIGSGALTDDTLSDARLMNLNTPGVGESLMILPDDRVVLRSETSGVAGIRNRIRIFDPSTGGITSVKFEGTGLPDLPSAVVGECTFQRPAPTVENGVLTGFITFVLTRTVAGGCFYDTTATKTYVNRYNLSGALIEVTPLLSTDGLHLILGRDQKNYFYRKSKGIVNRINPNNSLTPVLGTGSGWCANNLSPLNTSCLTNIFDMQINQDGSILYVQDGQLRRADSTSVQTLVGQSVSYGDGQNPLDARFREIVTLGAWNNGTTDFLQLYDTGNNYFKEFALATGSTITNIAGNGLVGASMSAVNPAATSPIVIGSFTTNPNNGDVYFSQDRVYKLNRSVATPIWSQISSGGTPTYTYQTGNNRALASIGGFSGSAKLLVGGPSGFLLHAYYTSGAVRYDPMMKIYDYATLTQTHLAGKTETVTVNSAFGEWGADGLALSNASIPISSGSVNATYVSSEGAYYLVTPTTSITSTSVRRAVKKLVPGGNMEPVALLPRDITAYTYRDDGTYRWVYYCAAGRLYKYRITTSTTGVETALSWPISSISCTGITLLYNSTRNSIIFPYSQGGLNGVAEYLNP